MPREKIETGGGRLLVPATRPAIEYFDDALKHGSSFSSRIYAQRGRKDCACLVPAAWKSVGASLDPRFDPGIVLPDDISDRFVALATYFAEAVPKGFIVVEDFIRRVTDPGTEQLNIKFINGHGYSLISLNDPLIAGRSLRRASIMPYCIYFAFNHQVPFPQDSEVVDPASREYLDAWYEQLQLVAIDAFDGMGHIICELE